MVRAQNIVKNYGGVEALKGVSFEVPAGEVFGVIGPDGAGKTTMFRILATLLLANSGSAWVAGWDVVKEYKEIRSCIGYMPGRFSLYQDLTVKENLELFATVFNTSIQENYHLIRDIYQQIEPFRERRAKKLSGGMKQKLALSCALIHKPKVLFLDEPTTGVDPVSRREFWEMLRKLKEQGITILVSTPYMDEACLCDRIALIQDGHFLQIDSPQNIVNQYPKQLYAINTSNNYVALQRLKNNPLVESVYICGDSVHFTTIQDNIVCYQKDHFTIENSEPIFSEPKVIPPTVEDCFIRLMSTNTSLTHPLHLH